jgi:EF-hand domain pair
LWGEVFYFADSPLRSGYDWKLDDRSINMLRRTWIACLMAMSLCGGLALAADDDAFLGPQRKAKAAKGANLAFKKIDTNHDGQISKAEFETAAEKLAERRGRASRGGGERLFDRLDTDHSGSLSPGEFQKPQAMRGQMRARSGRRNSSS